MQRTWLTTDLTLRQETDLAIGLSPTSCGDRRECQVGVSLKVDQGRGSPPPDICGETLASYVGHCTRFFTYVSSPSGKERTMCEKCCYSIVRCRKGMLREVESLAHGHTAGKWQRWGAERAEAAHRLGEIGKPLELDRNRTRRLAAFGGSMAVDGERAGESRVTFLLSPCH